MTDSAELTRFRGTRKTYLRNISNQERHILDLIQKPIDEKTETSLKLHLHLIGFWQPPEKMI